MTIAGLWLCAGMLRRNWGWPKTLAAGVAIGSMGMIRQDVATYTVLIAIMSLAAARIPHRREVSLSGSPGVRREILTRAAVMTSGAF